MSEQEVEVKFYIKKLPLFEQHIRSSGAELISARVHELNLRYDTPDGMLTRAHRVLRLRMDQRAMLTYKGPAEPGLPVSVRQEIEVEVSSFAGTEHLLEALGYQLVIMYEKYRTTYQLDNVRITLDEMPYGTFIELEGPDAESIQALAEKIHLDWEARLVDSYLSMFTRLRTEKGLKVRHLSFDEFKGIIVTPEDLGVKPAEFQGSGRPLAS
jgi:adenylate cyclase class 2